MHDYDPWAGYVRLQTRADSPVLSDQYWAIDDGLEVVLDEIAAGRAIPERQTANLLANRAAKYRHRRRLLTQNAHLVLSAGAVNEQACFEARRELEQHRARCTPREWRVLVLICSGHRYIDVAAVEQVPEATVKTWVRRTRMRLAA